MILNILQYNAHKSPENISTILYNPQATRYDILAIQEPAKCKGIDDIIYPNVCQWHPARGPRLGRAYFYINKRIPQSNCKLIAHDTPDILTF